MKNLIDGVWEYSQKNPHGFTLNVETMRPVTLGIACAFKETQNHFGREMLQKVIDHALKHHKTVGGWLDHESGLYYFDSIKVFNGSERRDAIKFGIDNEQIAIYDLTNQELIRIE